jgi:Fe2+ transport system protein FeoA
MMQAKLFWGVLAVSNANFLNSERRCELKNRDFSDGLHQRPQNVSSQSQNWQGFTFFGGIIEIQPCKSLDCLFSLGCMPGAEIQVLSRSHSGSVVIELRDRKLGLGAAIARCVVVINL